MTTNAVSVGMYVCLPKQGDPGTTYGTNPQVRLPAVVVGPGKYHIPDGDVPATYAVVLSPFATDEQISRAREFASDIGGIPDKDDDLAGNQLYLGDWTPEELILMGPVDDVNSLNTDNTLTQGL